MSSDPLWDTITTPAEITNSPKFLEFVREVKERFQTL
jgi:hypothetical protein